MFFFNKSVFLVDFLEDLVDIHNHILPGIDDGSKDLETTLEMIGGFKELGFKGCIATPHTMEDYYGNDSNGIIEKFNQIKLELEASNHRDFIISAASEYMMDGEFDNLIDTNNYLCLHNNYILTELSYFQKPNNLEELVFKMCQKGLKPILAHPERYRYITSIGAYKDLKSRGFELQLNLLSLTEHYGEDSFQKAKSLLDKGMYEFIGTDAHKPSHLEKIKSIKIKKNQVDSIKKLVENHKLIFNL
ncbi:CpsB/CapC family capsule biosynthesis tyrosine phosphatase [uncultured Nonlabens sp.]|uniref:tyrosine-protein phosphatase n=1 Tax=uncultured Nonlabens sp. TaxID=859306 RepID=UPI002605BE40|nr:CpsB/CapC family capsule biosynthesis tyrosine phosphatase [uncultured Nonlabens sp.]